MRLLEHKPQENCKQTFFYLTGVAVVFEYANLIGCRSSEKPDPVILLDWFRIRVRAKKTSGSGSLDKKNARQLNFSPHLFYFHHFSSPLSLFNCIFMA